ncbi:hypothetical protein MLD38_003485 [Melastoma candidum]|uniref:Uncharacterized protein n=1 Tax=Melastoma candidum TaxID=119954 RepID=A0ACB9S4A3_9MYRT|nr:hypothetical protein MLD38_003485 [Melastoma candidum]
MSMADALCSSTLPKSSSITPFHVEFWLWKILLVDYTSHVHGFADEIVAEDLEPAMLVLLGNKETKRTPLNWEMRSIIALGAARDIEYLHSPGPNVSHENIKSSNILLTKSYDDHLFDFGLVHLVDHPSTPARVAGYRAR